MQNPDNIIIVQMCTDVCIATTIISRNIKGTYYKRTPSIMTKVDIATKIDRDICCAKDATSSKSTVAIESAVKRDYRCIIETKLHNLNSLW